MSEFTERDLDQSDVMREGPVSSRFPPQNNSQAVGGYQPRRDASALLRSHGRVAHVDGQHQELLGAAMADRIEDGTSHLLGHARLDLHRNGVSYRPIDAGGPPGTIVEADLGSTIPEATAHCSAHYALAVFVMPGDSPHASGSANVDRMSGGHALFRTTPAPSAVAPMSTLHRDGEWIGSVLQPQDPARPCLFRPSRRLEHRPAGWRRAYESQVSSVSRAMLVVSLASPRSQGCRTCWRPPRST